MPLSFLTEAASISPEDLVQFENDANTIYARYADLCAMFSVPVADVEMVLSDDLQETVRQRLQSDTFEARREAVQVTAKCLYRAHTGESQDLVIVVASWPWQNSDLGNRIVGIPVLAHEFMHPLLDQLWAKNGIVIDHSADNYEDAQNALTVFDEYWADTLAFGVLKSLQAHATITLSDGSALTLEPSTVMVGGFVNSLKEFLQRAHTNWPDTIQSYRDEQIDFQTMNERIGNSFGQCAILMAHTQAHLDDTQGEAERSIFDLEELRELPAVRLYVGGPWRDLWACLKRGGPIPDDPETVKKNYAALVSACRTMFAQMWRGLGVEIESLPGGRTQFHVGEPLR